MTEPGASEQREVQAYLRNSSAGPWFPARRPRPPRSDPRLLRTASVSGAAARVASGALSESAGESEKEAFMIISWSPCQSVGAFFFCSFLAWLQAKRGSCARPSFLCVQIVLPVPQKTRAPLPRPNPERPHGNWNRTTKQELVHSNLPGAEMRDEALPRAFFNSVSTAGLWRWNLQPGLGVVLV